MSAMDMFWAAPPVTRTLTAAAVVVSLAAWSDILSPYYFVFLPYKILRLGMPQLWRLFTPFLLTGPKLGILMDPYFLFTWGKSVETNTARFPQPGDFFIFLMFVGSIIVATAGFYLNSLIFLQPLTVALAYMYAQDNANAQMTFYIVTFRAVWLPYAMLAMAFATNGPEAAFAEATGLLAAHLYNFLTRVWPEHGGGRNYLQTPDFVNRLFAQPGTGPVPEARGYGDAFRARPAVDQQRPAVNAGQGAAGWASGFSSGAWNGRGPGRRLGGE